MFRLIICLTIEVIYCIITAPLAGIGLLVGLIHKPTQYFIGRLIVGTAGHMVFFFSGGNITARGQDLIPSDETVLFVGNHRSQTDIPLLLATCKRTVGFVGKDSLKKTPGVNLWMILLGSLFLNRTNLREGVKTIKKGIQMLKDDHNLVVFPEGTRGGRDEMLPFKAGSMKLALKSGVKVVPFAIKGTGEMFEDNNYRFKKQDIYISFGEPIDLSLLDREAQKNSAVLVQGKVQEMLDMMPSL